MARGELLRGRHFSVLFLFFTAGEGGGEGEDEGEGEGEDLWFVTASDGGCWVLVIVDSGEVVPRMNVLKINK